MPSEWLKACIPTRYVIGLMGALAVINAYTMRVCLHVAITEMADSKTTPDSKIGELSCPNLRPENDTTVYSYKPEFHWDENTQGLVLGSFYWGYILTHIPGGLMADRWGGKVLLIVGILSTSILSLLTPMAAYAGGAPLVIFLRFVEGLGEGTTFPAITVLVGQWAPPQERSKMGSMVFAGTVLGTVVGNAGSGLIIHSMDGRWDGVFYVFGSLGALWCILAWFMISNTPDDHSYITEEEKDFIKESILASQFEKPHTIPWRAILTSLPVWGLIAGEIGHDWVFYTMGTELPKYMKSVLHFNVQSNGLLSAIPNLAIYISAQLCGWLSDWLVNTGKLSVTSHRKIFNTAGSMIPGIGLVGASYAGCDRVLVVVLFTIGMAFMAPFYSSLRVNPLDLSPNYSGLLMALVNGAGALAGILAPSVAGLLITNNLLEEWRRVFWVMLGMSSAGTVVYIFLGSGELQPWNSPQVA